MNEYLQPKGKSALRRRTGDAREGARTCCSVSSTTRSSRRGRTLLRSQSPSPCPPPRFRLRAARCRGRRARCLPTSSSVSPRSSPLFQVSNTPSAAASRMNPPFHGLEESVARQCRFRGSDLAARERRRSDEPGVLVAGEAGEVVQYTANPRKRKLGSSETKVGGPDARDFGGSALGGEEDVERGFEATERGRDDLVLGEGPVEGLVLGDLGETHGVRGKKKADAPARPTPPRVPTPPLSREPKQVHLSGRTRAKNLAQHCKRL